MTLRVLPLLVLAACSSGSGTATTSLRFTASDTLTQPSDGELGAITGLAVDPAGHVFVVDRDNAQLASLDSLGKITRKIGQRGRGPGELVQPRSVSVSSDSIWITDAGSDEVGIYTSAGAYVRTIRALPWLAVAEITFNAAGHGLLAQHGRDTAMARRVDGAGSLGAKLGRPVALPDFGLDFRAAKASLVSGTIPEGLLSYAAPALGPDGSAWVLRIVTGAVERYSPADSLLWTATLPDSILTRLRDDIVARTRADTSAVRFPFPNVLVAGSPVGNTLWLLLQGDRGETTIGRLTSAGAWLPWIYVAGTGHITAFAVSPVSSQLYLLDESEGTIVRVRLPVSLFAA